MSVALAFPDDDDFHGDTVEQTSGDHYQSGAHVRGVPAPTSPPAIPVSLPSAAPQAGAQAGASHTAYEIHRAPAGPVLFDPVLVVLADALDDMERTRIANENRVRQLTRLEADEDGVVRGFGLDLTHPEVACLAGVVDALAKIEHNATLNLKRALRKHPLGPWVLQTKGVGEKQGARLLAAIGDPYWNTLYNRPRTVSELWAYSGLHVLRVGQVPIATHLRYADSGNLPADHMAHEAHGTLVGGSKRGGDTGHTDSDAQASHAGVAPARQRGQRANWSTMAKMRVYLVAESCIKQHESPYRPVYDAGRKKYADAVHKVECRRCGPSGHPAAAGSPLSAGHQHARAMRLVSKALLKDLWLEARRLHEESA